MRVYCTLYKYSTSTVHFVVLQGVPPRTGTQYRIPYRTVYCTCTSVLVRYVQYCTGTCIYGSLLIPYYRTVLTVIRISVCIQYTVRTCSCSEQISTKSTDTVEPTVIGTRVQNIHVLYVRVRTGIQYTRYSYTRTLQVDTVHCTVLVRRIPVL